MRHSAAKPPADRPRWRIEEHRLLPQASTVQGRQRRYWLAYLLLALSALAMVHYFTSPARDTVELDYGEFKSLLHAGSRHVSLRVRFFGGLSTSPAAFS